MKQRAKAIVMFAIVTSIMTLLCGCSSEEYPYITYHESIWVKDNKTIYLDDTYVPNDGHLYDVIETEDGYDLVIHFVNNDKQMKDQFQRIGKTMQSFVYWVLCLLFGLFCSSLCLDLNWWQFIMAGCFFLGSYICGTLEDEH